MSSLTALVSGGASGVFGTNPPAHPWETSALAVGAREYDAEKGLMWTLVQNPPEETYWLWAFDFSVAGFDADADGLADEDIEFFDAGAVLKFTITAGSNIAQGMMTGFGLNNDVPTLCHRDGSTYYLQQIDDGAQADPIIQSASAFLEAVATGSLNTVSSPTAVQVLSVWENRTTGNA